MKTIISLALFLFFATASFSQTKETSIKKFYLEIAGGGSSQNGSVAEFAVQAIFKNNWTASFSYHNIDMNPKNLPADYKQGYTLFILIPIPDVLPSNNMNVFSFSGGKFFSAGRKTWFTTEAGLSIVNGQTYSFTRQPVTNNGLYFSSNYAAKEESKTTIGGMLKADFNWAILRFLGLGAGVFANFNSIQSPVGFQVKLMVGKLNLKRK